MKSDNEERVLRKGMTKFFDLDFERTFIEKNTLNNLFLFGSSKPVSFPDDPNILVYFSKKLNGFNV